MDKNFATNFTLETNLQSEYKLSSEFLLDELEEFIQLCDESNYRGIEDVKSAFLSDVNLRAVYRITPKEERLKSLIKEVSSERLKKRVDELTAIGELQRTLLQEKLNKILKPHSTDRQCENLRVSEKNITELADNEVFVFGSNLGGLHGAGAASTAMQWGAIWGKGIGLQGQTYAIPTMCGSLETMIPYVDEFIEFAKDNPKLRFLVTEIGCGIAGYTPIQIAPLFTEAINIVNIALPQSFWDVHLIAVR